MRADQRRRLDRVLLVFGAIGIALVAVIGAFAGDTERIGAYWTHAHINDDGSAEVIEVIDYDFGSQRKHGLLRQIPDVSPETTFTVSSPSAPDQVQALSWWQGTELRVGDPNATISNRHRYALVYPHDGLADADGVAWNAVGDGWTVAVQDIEVHITADRSLDDAVCNTGALGEFGGCTVEILEPGHLVVHHDKVTPGEFLTVEATFGAAANPTLPSSPTGTAPDPGSGWKVPPILAGLAALAGAAVISPLVRRQGRELVYEGGSVDAAFGPGTDDAPVRLADHRELMEMTTIEFEAPREYSAALGGVIHMERVLPDHKTAWLLECAIRDEIELDDGDDDPTIRRGTATPNAAVSGVLDTMFGGRGSIELDSYDKQFAAGWGMLDSRLEEWRRESGLWDSAGRRHRNWAIGLGILGLVLGAALAGFASALASRNGSGPYPAIVIGGLLGGAGLAALVRAWELRVRSAEGSGAWIRIESFRRFLHESEAEHVERAADMGLLRQYTAWAVALGEVDRWEKAVETAARAPDSSVSTHTNHLGFVAAAPRIAGAVSTASRAPSSSGGGGGGGSGGGGGGGGGGSW